MWRLSLVLALTLGGLQPLFAQESFGSRAIIAVLQSESTGEEPKNEFATVDLHFAFRHFASIAQVDIATSEDGATPESSALTDAGFQIVRGVGGMGIDGERVPYFGAWVKVFQTEPMLGVTLGSVELSERMEGSRFSLGWLWPFRDDHEVLGKQNLYGEFLMRLTFPDENNIIGLLNHVNFRISALVPTDESRDVVGKVAAIIPLNGVLGLGG